MENNENWITMNGTHIFVDKDNKKQSIEKFLNKHGKSLKKIYEKAKEEALKTDNKGMEEKPLGKSNKISLNKWNDRIYINGLTSGDDKIWLEPSSVDYGSEELNKKMGGKGYGYDIKYKNKPYGYNLAKELVEDSSSELYKELEKIENGKRRTFEELLSSDNKSTHFEKPHPSKLEKPKKNKSIETLKKEKTQKLSEAKTPEEREKIILEYAKLIKQAKYS